MEDLKSIEKMLERNKQHRKELVQQYRDIVEKNTGLIKGKVYWNTLTGEELMFHSFRWIDEIGTVAPMGCTRRMNGEWRKKPITAMWMIEKEIRREVLERISDLT
jgi:hypothetical protein